MNKTIRLTGLILSILAIFAFSSPEKSLAKGDDETKTSTVVFSVTEMGCATDRKLVETALYRKKGVKKVKIEEETITVTYNSAKVSVDELKAIIENTGTCEDPNAKVHKVTVKKS